MNKVEIAKLERLANKSITPHVIISVLGYIMLVAGFIMLGVGISKAAATDNMGYLGVAYGGLGMALGPGLGFSIAGTICWIIMGSKIKSARNKLGK